MIKMKKCPICEKGKLIEQKIPYSVYGIKLGDFPAKICTSCDEQWFSEETAKNIDREINKIIEECYQEAVIILEGKIDHLHKLAEVLLREETVDAQDVEIIIECKRMGQAEPLVLIEE